MFTYQIKNPKEAFINIEIGEGEFSGKILKSNELQPCMELTCTCGNIYFAADEHLYALDVVNNQVLKYTESEAIDSGNDTYLKSLENEISDEQWGELNAFFKDLKGMASEVADADKIEAHFENYKKVLQESQMVSYFEVLPWSFDFNVEIEGKKYWISDFYCVKPSCSCTSVLLLFSFSYEEDPSLELWYDYRTHEVSMGQLDDKKMPVTKIIREIRYTQAEKFRQTLSSRHKRMTVFFSNFLKRNKISPSLNSPVIASDTIGRNDLCPCGSGKKYKKCCGA
ncbi:SEC-C metal-binding domain-containing protein [Emticicia sp. BO119]|uniref:SEC-C metal-binding domain-containing protein n=1 Tax=Emticicia sp. BO119 TaxID=2757768 RepID=UPI001C6A8673|nr:SEC-C metal-binding domain-containing protein [Emticicia sp. BO119]